MDDEDSYFGESVAAGYDAGCSDMFEPGVVDPVVEVLAGGGRALELGIGTRRIALPLTNRGVPVQGIDLSRVMVARLCAKPGGEAIGVTIGDFATARADRDVRGRVLGLQRDHEPDNPGGTGGLLPQRWAHLEPGGSFVIEVMIPDLRRLPAGQNIVPIRVSPTLWTFDVCDVARR